MTAKQRGPCLGPLTGKGWMLSLPPCRHPSQLTEPGVSPIPVKVEETPARQVIPKNLWGEQATQ